MHAVTQYSPHRLCHRICSSAIFRLLVVVLIALASVGMSSPLRAQDTDQPPSVAQLRSTYDASVDEFRSTLKALRRTEAHYLFSNSEESHDFKEEWDALATKSEAQFEGIRDNAFALFEATEEPDEDLVTVVRNLTIGTISLGHLGVGHRITQKLVELNPDDQLLAEELIRVEIFNNKFDDAVAFKAENIAKIEKFNKKEKVLFGYINTLKKNFDRELKLREKDKTADLPRVEMKIQGKGTVVLELFEDEAPETVANFISLAEAGFYDGLIFHHAVNGFLAHSGAFISFNKYKPVGYTIYDECKKPERRHHFRGSISTWTHPTKPNSCGSQFSIMRMPAPYFTNTHQTVFGRVIEGMEIIDDVENTYAINEEDGNEEPIPDIVPDTIESVKVIRKRDHKYEPNPVK